MRFYYSSKQIPSIAEKFPIRWVFGSKHRSGFKFGREVPVILVYDDKEYTIDVYSRLLSKIEDMTIRQYPFGILSREHQNLLLERKLISGVFSGVADDLLEFRLDYLEKQRRKRRAE